MSNPGLAPWQWGALALGGTLGTWARFYVSSALAARGVQFGWPTSLGMPLGTWSVNVLGGLFIGVVAALAAGKPAILSADARLLLAVGFCGAFTTFSTFGLETLTLVQAGRWGQAVAYVLATNAFVLLSTGIGLWLGRWIHPAP